MVVKWYVDNYNVVLYHYYKIFTNEQYCIEVKFKYEHHAGYTIQMTEKEIQDKLDKFNASTDTEFISIISITENIIEEDERGYKKKKRGNYIKYD